MKRFAFLFVFISLILSVVGPAMARDNHQDICYSVLFNNNGIPADFNEKLAACGAEIVYSVPEIGFVQIKGDSNTIFKIRELSYLKAVNPSISWSIPGIRETSAQNVSNINPDTRPLWELQWDIQQVTENGASYELGAGSHGVVVGIIDSGIDRDHPDLKDNILSGKNFVPENGYMGEQDFESGDPNDFDDLTGHGTHLAGTLAANGAMLGVAPDVGIRAYRVFGGKTIPESAAESAWIFAAIIAAADDGVDVISLSLSSFDVKGQYFYTDPVTGEKLNLGNDVADFLAWKRAVQYAVDKDCLVVAAAGNDGLNATKKKEVTDYLNDYLETYSNGLSVVGAGFEVPGTIPGVITVSATGPDGNLASYSNYGPGFVDVAAPGGDVDLYLEYMQNGNFDEYVQEQLFTKEWCLSTWNNGSYDWMTGTSMAVPKVSAVAALIIDKYGKMAPQKLAKMIQKDAVSPVTGKDKRYYGAGHINAVQALTD